MGKKNNMSTIVLLLCVIIVLLITIIGYLLFKDANKNLNNKEDNTKVEETVVSEEDTTKEVVYTEDELFDKVKGIYKYVSQDGTNFIVRFYKDTYNDNKKTFTYGMARTDGGIAGEITEVEYLSNSSYKITVFQKGCHEDGETTCMQEFDDQTHTIEINIKELENKKIDIKIADKFNTYNYITDNWDEVEKYLDY